MAKKIGEVKKVGRYSRKEVKVHKDRIDKMLSKLLTYFDGKGNIKEVKVKGLSGDMMLWEMGRHSKLLGWLEKNGAVEDAGLVLDACFIERTRFKNIKKEVLKKLLEMVQDSKEEFVAIYPYKVYRPAKRPRC